MAGKNKKKTTNNAYKKIRKDNNGRVLHTGEIQLPNGTYRFKKMVKGIEHTVSAITLDELREKEKDLLRSLEDGINPKRRKATVDDVFRMWEETLSVKPRTKRDYLRRYTDHTQEHFGKREIRSITYHEVRKYHIGLADRGLSFSTLKATNQVLHQIFVLAIREGLADKDPTEGAIKGLDKDCCKPEKEVSALTEEQQETFFVALENTPKHRKYMPFFTFLVETGLRAGEAIGLRWCDVNFERGLISINHSLDYTEGDDGKYHWVVHSTKTDKSDRIIPMSDNAKAALLTEKAKGIQCKATIDGYTDFIFLNRQGKPYYLTTLNGQVLKPIAEKYNKTVANEELKLPDLHCHVFRHTFATRMYALGVPPELIKKIMGHADVSTTLNIYTDMDIGLMIQAMQRCGLIQVERPAPKELYVPNYVPNDRFEGKYKENIIPLFGDNFTQNAYYRPE